ncbi:MAG: SDR family NAD(P)-dependent oxidoreductase [Thermaerobacter sp.]|nr:SDR family NAD(P)-dependent oxidoreductase [Thermaerobacter sp.]
MRRILVTGASRGIGRAVAERLMQAGDIVIGVSRGGGETVQHPSGGRIEMRAFDLADQNPARLVDDVWAGGGLDGLVNNAGTSPAFTSAHKLERPAWDEVLHLNLTVPFSLAQAFARLAIAGKRPGAMVMVSSIAARIGLGRLAAYTASKGGLSALTRSLAVDWAPYDLRVNAVEPGYVQTEMTEGLFQNSDLHGAILKRTLLGRTADPGEIAEVVVFLLSPSAAYLTGSLVAVDGGYSAN